MKLLNIKKNQIGTFDNLYDKKIDEYWSSHNKSIDRINETPAGSVTPFTPGLG